MVALTVNVFKRMRVKFALFDFETERVDLEISLAIPSKVAVMFSFVRTIVFQIPSILRLRYKGCMPLLLVVLALWNTGVHISIANSSDKAANVEAVLENHHIRF